MTAPRQGKARRPSAQACRLSRLRDVKGLWNACPAVRGDGWHSLHDEAIPYPRYREAALFVKSVASVRIAQEGNGPRVKPVGTAQRVPCSWWGNAWWPGRP